MYKIIIITLFSILLNYELEEKLSITELRDEAQLFILNKSYIDAIANYEKIYDIQSLIFGSKNKNLSETLIVLGDLYYKIDDEINTLRCFQEAIHIMHYNSLNADQFLITPFEYLYEIYLNNDQLEISELISNHLSYLYSLDTLSYENTDWTNIGNILLPFVDTCGRGNRDTSSGASIHYSSNASRFWNVASRIGHRCDRGSKGAWRTRDWERGRCGHSEYSVGRGSFRIRHAGWSACEW